MFILIIWLPRHGYSFGADPDQGAVGDVDDGPRSACGAR
jgi:hypothetical protein